VDKNGNPPEHTNQRLYDPDTGRFCEFGLTQQVKMQPWPTPDAGMVTGGRVLPKGTTSTGQTPDGRKVQVGLTNAVKAWGTPTARDHKDGGNVSGVPENGLLGRQAVNRSESPGKLHGRWTLALQGFPPDWCDDLPPDPLSLT